LRFEEPGPQIWRWKQEYISRLARMRLRDG
jgi:hypothetical protein